MKKLVLFFMSVVLSSGLLVAQSDNCMSFFPTTEGAVLVSKMYDANDNLLSTMTYRVNKVNTNVVGSSTLVGFSMADANDNVVNNGDLTASCIDGSVRLKMTMRGFLPETLGLLSTNTELIGNFLDYPSPFDDTYVFDNPIDINGGEIMIEPKDHKDKAVKVQVYNRSYATNERIFTPARRDSFGAAKVNFDFKVTTDNEEKEYKGVEWYAPNAGIIRSETYDKDNNLVNYTVLTTLRNNE